MMGSAGWELAAGCGLGGGGFRGVGVFLRGASWPWFEERPIQDGGVKVCQIGTVRHPKQGSDRGKRDLPDGGWGKAVEAGCFFAEAKVRQSGETASSEGARR